MGGIAVPAFQVNVDAVTPGVFLHDADDLRKEHLLRPVCVVVLSRILDNTTYPELLIIPKSLDSSWEIK